MYFFNFRFMSSLQGSWENGARPRVIEDPSKAYSYVSNIREAEVHSVGDAMAFLEAGLQNRSVCTYLGNRCFFYMANTLCRDDSVYACLHSCDMNVCISVHV